MLEQIEATKGYRETFWKHLRNDAQHTLDRLNGSWNSKGERGGGYLRSSGQSLGR